MVNVFTAVNKPGKKKRQIFLFGETRELPTRIQPDIDQTFDLMLP